MDYLRDFGFQSDRVRFAMSAVVQPESVEKAKIDGFVEQSFERRINFQCNHNGYIFCFSPIILYPGHFSINVFVPPISCVKVQSSS